MPGCADAGDGSSEVTEADYEAAVIAFHQCMLDSGHSDFEVDFDRDAETGQLIHSVSWRTRESDSEEEQVIADIGTCEAQHLDEIAEAYSLKFYSREDDEKFYNGLADCLEERGIPVGERGEQLSSSLNAAQDLDPHAYRECFGSLAGLELPSE